MEADQLVLDGFGDHRYRVPGKRGRPPFQWTPENGRKVSMLCSAGWSNARIAAVVIDARTGKSISEPTLKRHFRSELQLRSVARDRDIARQMEIVWLQAEAGNMSAMKLYREMMSENDRMLIEARLAKSDKSSEAEPKRGVKEQRAIDAVEADANLERQIQEEVAVQRETDAARH